MTHFEYLSIVISIVLGLGVVRLVDGLRAVLVSGRRYWVHSLWVVILLALYITHWWTSWSFRNALWTLPAFVLILAGPGALYFLATTLVPDDPKGIAAWQHHFFERRRLFFSALLAYIGLSIIDGYVVLGAPLVHPARAIQALGGVVAGVGLTSDSPRTHAAIVLIFLAILAAASASLFSRPDAVVVPQ